MQNFVVKSENIIRSITKNSDDSDEKHMKVKFNSNELPLNKTIEIPSMTIVNRATLYENKYYPRVFLNEFLYKK